MSQPDPQREFIVMFDGSRPPPKPPTPAEEIAWRVRTRMRQVRSAPPPVSISFEDRQRAILDASRRVLAAAKAAQEAPCSPTAPVPTATS